MTERVESHGRESAANEPPLFHIPHGRPLNYFIDLTLVRDLNKEREAILKKWGLPKGYSIITPGNYDTVRFPPPQSIAVYAPAIELGLRFPIHPLIREVLELLHVTVAELYPNAWGCLTAFWLFVEF